ncbi:MAG: GTP-binding signal recognition particle [Parcubacteria group bacterium Gr01-1014_33]|nr:MAG: GTP-binding signal recognition particle [Parcubacteria group bacterium Gr01-1014_33]
MATIILKEESYRLMGLLFEIHNKLGPIYKEINYQEAIEAILKRENISFTREKEISIKIGDLKVSSIFGDFIVDNKILLEVKAKPFIKHEDVRQTSRMLKSEGLPLAIVANFKRKSLEYKRIVNASFGNNS